jgi:hypothetical protein
MAQAMSRDNRHPNFALERPADSHSLVAAAQSGRLAHNRAVPQGGSDSRGRRDVE